MTSVNHTFFDNQNNYWLCNDFGLLKITISKNYFKSFLPNIFSSKNQSSFRVILVNAKQYIICCQDKIFVQNNNTSYTIPETKNFSICKTDRIWIGNYSINTLNLKTHQLEKKVLIDNEVWCLYPFSKKQLLVGSTLNAFKYDISTNTLTEINALQFPKPKLIYNYFKNSLNEICMVADNGFYILNNNATDVVDYYGALSNIKTKQFPFEGITAIIENSNNTYWVITANEGLFLWNKAKNTFKKFGYEAGFLSLTCLSMQKDNDKNLWIGTDLGLAFFNTKTQYVTFYAKQNGLQEEEFNRISSYKDTNGQLYFGGINGITTFKPHDF